MKRDGFSGHCPTCGQKYLEEEIERLTAALLKIDACYVDRFGGAVIGLKSGIELDEPARIARSALGTAYQQSKDDPE